MKLWFIKTEEFLSIDQLYNTKGFGTIVDFSLEEISKNYTDSTMCFVIENLIEVDEDTTVPVLESLSGFLNKCPAYKILTSVSSRLPLSKLDNVTITKIVLNNYKAPELEPYSKTVGSPNAVRFLIENSNRSEFASALIWLANYRMEKLPDGYVINILEEAVKEGKLDTKFAEAYKKICTILQLLEGVRNGSSR